MKLTPDHGQWGILGGAFDPVHRGHLVLAGEIHRMKKLTGVLFVPSVRHPFKKDQCKASFSDRVTMLKLAVKTYDHFLVSEIETDMNLSGYTLDTIRAFKQLYPKTEFSFIIGADNLGDLSRWHEPEQILKEIKVLVGSRPAYGSDQHTAFPHGSIELVPTCLVHISSSEIRCKIKDNISAEQLDKLVPESVRKYIFENGLYR